MSTSLKLKIRRNAPEILITAGVFLFLYSFLGQSVLEYFELEPITQKIVLLVTKLAGAICVTLGFILHSKRGKKDD